MCDDSKYPIRHFEQADLSEVQEVWKDGFKIYTEEPLSLICSRIIEKQLNSDMKDITKSYMSVDGANFWVVEDKMLNPPKIVGIVACVPYESEEQGVYEMQRLSVRAEYRKKSIGKLLLETVENYVFEELEGTKIVITTAMDMTTACRFYERHQYGRTHQIMRDYGIYKTEGFEKQYFAQQFEKTSVQHFSFFS